MYFYHISCCTMSRELFGWFTTWMNLHRFFCCHILDVDALLPFFVCLFCSRNNPYWTLINHFQLGHHIGKSMVDVHKPPPFHYYQTTQKIPSCSHSTKIPKPSHLFANGCIHATYWLCTLSWWPIGLENWHFIKIYVKHFHANFSNIRCPHFQLGCHVGRSRVHVCTPIFFYFYQSVPKIHPNPIQLGLQSVATIASPINNIAHFHF